VDHDYWLPHLWAPVLGCGVDCEVVECLWMAI